jgi:cytochrome c oxidase cbb3-type subunit I/II
MDDPRSTSPGSIMPRYSWLLTQKIDTNAMPPRIAALRKVGVPYPVGYENGDAQKDMAKQAEAVVLALKVGMVDSQPDREIIAIIAYLQRLGKDIKAEAPVPVATATK